MPVYRVGAARHPEQGENEEAVSDSVNTVASLTGFTLRSCVPKNSFAQRMMPQLIFYKDNIKNLANWQLKI